VRTQILRCSRNGDRHRYGKEKAAEKRRCDIDDISSGAGEGRTCLLTNFW